MVETKKEEKRLEKDLVSYIFGVLSIVFGFVSPAAGFILGTVGLFYIRGEKSNLSSKAKKLNIIGIVISLLVLVFGFFMLRFYQSQVGQLPL